ncbi:MAG TPA: PIN domain-containing protein [Acidobacteriaceae bacterium]|nr:PIN domain-containing protein [Acidobacteriaceae bacterium]
MTYILDSSAILRYTDNEAGADRVEKILQDYLKGSAGIGISSLHWGEVANKLYQLRGRQVMNNVLQRLAGLGIEVIPATAEQAVEAGLIRADHKIPYVDAFGVVLVSASNHVFVTADFDLKPAAKFVRVEFLPTK